MPPAGKRNASVILFDVNTDPDFLERSQRCLLSICAVKWFEKSADCTKIILLNSAETNNSLARKFGKCPHVSEVTDVINYDPKLIEPCIKDAKTGEGDWLLALAVALEAIQDNYYEAKGIVTLQLLFITDFSHDANVKEKSIKFIIDQINHMDVYLYILGPEVKMPKILATHEDIQQWSKHIEFIDTDNTNLPIAREIVMNTKGIICSLKFGELFHSYINHSGLQPWKVPLTIGSALNLNCSTVRFLRKKSGPRIKAITEEGYKEPWKWHMIEDINEEVPYENVIGGVFKHNKFVPLPKDVEQVFKFTGERCFKIVGFTKTSNIPDFYMQGDGSSYVENGGSKLFDLLLNVLSDKKMCAIARKVYMKNCKPKLVALLPRYDERVFLLVELPYKEAINANFKEQDINLATKLDKTLDPAIDAAYNYLKQLDITEPSNRDENESIKWPLSIDLMNDMRLKVVYERCLKKYLDKDVQITAEPDVDLPHFAEDVTTLKQYIPASNTDV